MINKNQELIIQKVLKEVSEEHKWLSEPFLYNDGILVSDGYRTLVKNVNECDLTGEYKIFKKSFSYDDDSIKANIKFKKNEIQKLLKGCKSYLIIFVSTGSELIIADGNSNILLSMDCIGEKAYTCIKTRYLKDTINFINEDDINILIESKIKPLRFKSDSCFSEIFPNVLFHNYSTPDSEIDNLNRLISKYNIY